MSGRGSVTEPGVRPTLDTPSGVHQRAELDLAERYERLVDTYNAMPADTPEDLDEALYWEIKLLDDEIAARPCRTREDARAKVAHAIRGLIDGERGTEVPALCQVMTFLEAC